MTIVDYICHGCGQTSLLKQDFYFHFQHHIQVKICFFFPHMWKLQNLTIKNCVKKTLIIKFLHNEVFKMIYMYIYTNNNITNVCTKHLMPTTISMHADLMYVKNV